MKKYRGLIIGMLIGASLMFSVQAFAAEGDVIEAVFAKFNLVINGQPKETDTVPLVYNGTSYLPLRDMANLFGYDVTYKADSRTIEMTNSVTSVTYSNTYNSSEQIQVLDETYYKYSDIKTKLDALHPDNNKYWTVHTVSGSTIVTYDGVEYKIKSGENDGFKDITTGEYYDAESYLAQFLPSEIFVGLQKYKYDTKNQIAIPIN